MPNSSSLNIHERRHIRRKLQAISDKTLYAEDKVLKAAVQELIALIARELT